MSANAIRYDHESDGKVEGEGSSFDSYASTALDALQKVLDREIDKYPREAFPARGAVLVSLERRLAETREVADRLGDYPPEGTPENQ